MFDKYAVLLKMWTKFAYSWREISNIKKTLFKHHFH